MTAAKSQTNWNRVRSIPEDARIPWSPNDGPYDPNNAVATEQWLSEARVRRPGQRGRGTAPGKEQVSLRLSPEVLAHFRAGGPGWQARIDDTLKKAITPRRRRKAD